MLVKSTNAFQALMLLAGMAAALMASAPAWADAITYSGTLGDAPILLEATEPADGPLIGRYTYLSKGADIPLHQLKGQGLTLAEERPCTPEICVEPEGSDAPKPPLGAHWQIEGVVGDATLAGSWQDGNKAALPVTLRRVGTRAYERQDFDTFGSFTWHAYDEPLTEAASPYDYLKIQVPLEEGETRTMAGNTYRDVVDPRTKFPFPRIVSLADGSDPSAANDFLAQQHRYTSYNALACLSMGYLSGGWNRALYGGYSPLGDYDAEQVSVLYLSPKVMTMVQSGSVNCGGASPYNHINYSTIDVTTGEPLDLSRVFKGWVASKDDAPVDLATARANPLDYDWRPDAELLAYVREAWMKDPAYDPAYDADCDVGENIPTKLDISFAEGDKAVFRIAGLGSSQVACEADLFTVPLGEIKTLLTPDAFDLFPSLRN